MEKLNNARLKPVMIIFGGFLFSFGMNQFIIPQHLFSGGAVGLTQLIEVLIRRATGFQGGNLYGIIYTLINIPLLFIAYKCMGKRFLINTLLGAGSISVFMGILPIPTEVTLDCLTSLLVGGIVTGVGIGILLVAGGCGGGIDILGVWAAQKYKNASVGKISIAFNAILYIILLFLFDWEVVIHSLIYMVFFSLVLDKVHYQNINVRLMVFTKKDGIDQLITKRTGRGVTEWKGVGAYTREETNVFVTCINKYEVTEFLELINEIDPHAFIISDEGVNVYGNFEKRV